MVRGRTLLAPLRDADFRRLWVAQAVSVIGDKLHQIAMAVLVFERTGSMLQMGVMLAMTALPAALFSVWAGALVDRWDRRRTMFAADLVRAALVIVVPIAANLDIMAAYAIAFCVATVSLFFEPARLALVPDLLPDEQLMGANSLDNASISVSEIVGLAVGGALVAAIGYRAAFFIDSVSFLVSAAFVLGVRHRASQLAMDLEDAPVNVGAAVKDSFRHIWERPLLRDLISVQGLGAVPVLGSITLVNVLALEHFHGGSGALAALDGAITVGLLAGSLLVGSTGPRYAGWKFLSGLLGFGVLLVGVAVAPRFTPALFLLFLGGIANMWFQVPTITMLQTYADPEVRGRVFATRVAITRIAGVAGLVGAGYLAEKIGVPSAFGVLGALVCATALVGTTSSAIRRA